MDILQKYDQENPQGFSQIPPDSSLEECSFLMCMVVRLSGGRIRDARQINRVLLSFAIIIFLFTFFLITQNVNLLPVKKLSPQESRRQLEEYKKIQPF